ncbi:MAG TPA: sigma-54 dependent transcriptional regulator [Blastocatellia bacterium]|jgi:two-component system response regulator PilR (NtrC family)|nr:sigma-54 dependent transcriptional regulator [Blastocatellia bacterium]
MEKILVVDDERSMRELLELVLKRQGYSVHTAENGTRALELVRQNVYDLIISDVKMPDINGIELLERVREISPESMVVMITAFATVDTARRAFKLGAEDFYIKDAGFDVEELKITIGKALEKKKLRQENTLLKRELRQRNSLENIVGRSPQMQAVYQMIDIVAATTSTVLITGESGTGKELVARAIHSRSNRAAAPFVSINCGAFTETLLESELFGYMKGSFTGAVSNRKGLFEAAEGGTIFLDEIGETTPAMQVKMLRVLQERSIRRVGGVEEIPVDCRVVAATNRDLANMVEDGTFRNDLFYRISVIPIEMPPLRARRTDIPDLVQHFLEKYSNNAGRPKLGISEDAMRYLESYDWPGNVRELENTIERAVALEPTDVIMPERMPERILKYKPRNVMDVDLPDEGMDLEAYLAQLEKDYIIRALQRTGGNQTRAAEILNMSVRSLRHLLDKHKIRQTASLLRESTALSDSIAHK